MNTTTIETQSQQVKKIKGYAGSINVIDIDPGKGLPVLFVHSFGGSTRHWDKQSEHLKAMHRVIALDMRGHGDSKTLPGDEYAVESLANDIATVVDSLKLGKFVLVGHSMGGSSAIAYAGKHPGRVAGLLITGTPGKTPEAQSKQIIASLESEKYDTVMKNYMDQLLQNAKPATDKLERDGMNKISKEASINIIRSVFKYDPLPDLRNYPGPKLIVSKSNEEQSNSLHKAFPGIPYKTVEGTSHWIQLDKPEEFNNILDEFLEKVEKEPTG